MTFLLVLASILLIAALAPVLGADSRRLTDRAGGPPDLMPPSRDRGTT